MKTKGFDVGNPIIIKGTTIIVKRYTDFPVV